VTSKPVGYKLANKLASAQLEEQEGRSSAKEGAWSKEGPPSPTYALKLKQMRKVLYLLCSAQDGRRCTRDERCRETRDAERREMQRDERCRETRDAERCRETRDA
jgi:hypothetical protein